MSEMDDWLRRVGLERYAPVFAEHEITTDVLPHLTEADVEALGLPIGPRRRLLVEIRALAGGAKEPAAPAPAATGERRQLTVMFCDLVGSTALSARLDPEELREVMQTYRKACGDVVARYDGYVAQYLGDGVMVYFGWPTAHEDDAERGVRCALDVVRAVKSIRAARPLAVRVGLATGPVVVGASAHGDNAESRLAVGEAPNLAARVQALAGPDEVMIGLATRRLIRDVFTLADTGAHRLKGIAEPVQVWRVVELRRAEGRFDAAHRETEMTGLVGRDQELALLLDRWEDARAGRGRVVAVGGEAGIGKSRLSHVLRRRIGEVRSLRFQCSPYHLNSALYPFVEQLEFAAGFAREDAPERKLDKLEAAIPGGPERAAAAAPLLAALLSLPTDRYPPVPLSPQKRKEETLEALAGRIEALARDEPVLVVFEDLHWIDPTSQELLDALVARVAGLPVLLVATHRPEHAPSWARLPHVTCVSLSRLERGKVAQLVEEVTGGRELPPQVLEQILSHTDGVPLFVEELTKSVLESGLLREAGDHYDLDAPLPALAIPTSLRDSLAARLDRLSDVKEIAQIGACIGREFTHDLLSRVATLAGPELDAAIGRLVDAGLVSRRGVPPGEVYTFKHALVQDAAYDLLLRSRRQQLHARIARVLSADFADEVRARPELPAHHHTQAGDLAAAIPLWRRAGALAMARVALREALAHLQKALTLTGELPPDAERDRLELSIREQMNAALTGLRGWAAPEVGVNTEAILRLAERCGDAQSLVLGLWWMWTNTITQGRIADSLPWAERLVAAGGSSDDAELRLLGPAATMVSDFLLGRLAESRAHAERVLSLYDPQRAARWLQLTGHELRTFVEVYTCQLLWMQGHPDRARRMSEGSAAHARTVGHAFNLVWALVFGAYAFAYRRDTERVLERAAEADRLAREQGIAFVHQVSVPQIAAVAKLQQGRSPGTVAELRRAIEAWTSLGGRVRVPYLKSALAEAVAREGDVPAALELIDECLEQIARPECRERVWLAEVLRLKGWMLAQLGRDDEAETELRAAVACAREQEARSWELRAATTLAALLDRTGRREAAREVLAPPLAWFTEGFDTQDLADARALLDRLSG